MESKEFTTKSTNVVTTIGATAITFLQRYDQPTLKKNNIFKETNDNSEPSLLMAVGSAHKQIRIYDVLSNHRRPIQFTPEGIPCEYRIMSLVQNPLNLQQLIVADAGGYIYCIKDLNTLPRGSVNAKRMQTTHGTSIKNPIKATRYVGPAGSIRQMQIHPTQPFLVCLGLDRMVRVYNTVQQKQIHCVYFKQRLNCILLDTTTSTKDKKNDETCSRCGEKYKDIGRGGSLCEDCEKYYAQDN